MAERETESNTGETRTAEHDVLSIAEINRRFSDEWVLVEDPVTDRALEVTAGKVLIHDRDRDEVYRVAVARRPRRFAVLYTGTLPPDAVVVL